MGLFSGLLTWPVTAPVRATSWLAQQILAVAEGEYYDESAIRAQIAEAEIAYAAGDLDDEAYEAVVDPLLQRLVDARSHSERARTGDTDG